MIYNDASIIYKRVEFVKGTGLRVGL